MRRISMVAVLVLSGCGGAMDASSESVQSPSDAAQIAASMPSRPIVGTLRMRDRDVPLSADALDARGNEDLSQMTAQAPGRVIADIAPEHTSRGEAVPTTAPDLRAIHGDLF